MWEGAGAWTAQHSSAFLLYLEPPTHQYLSGLYLPWLPWSSAGVVGVLYAMQSPRGALFHSEALETPVLRAVGCGLWAGRTVQAGPLHPYPLPCSCLILCFVLSGPRLHPWQKESTNPMKVSPQVYGWGPCPPRGWMGKPASFSHVYGGWGGRGAGIWRSREDR